VRIESFIGLRFLWSPRQDRAVSVITWISGVGVMLGVAALIVTISVMNGFRTNLLITVSGTTAHVRLLPQEGVLTAQAEAELLARIQAVPGVEAVAPYLSRQAFLRVEGQFRAVQVRGIDPTLEPQVTELARFIHGDRFSDAESPQTLLQGLRSAPGGGSGILLGAQVARSLGLLVGDDVQIISPVQRQTPIGPVPLIKRLRVVGLVETGLGGTDDVLAFVDYRIAQHLFRLDGVAGLAVRTADPLGIDALDWQRRFPRLRVLTWAQENKNVFQVMRLEKLGLFVIMTLIIVVSFFNIISSLVMLVLEKRKEIGVLKSLGATDGMVRKIFLMQGFWIGTLGTLSGLTLGLLTCWVLATFDIVRLPQGVFPLANRLPVQVEVWDLLAITAASYVICLTVTLFPATQAARVHPVDSLRHG
jgi:lipoprotein-releasing system permease protein